MQTNLEINDLAVLLLKLGFQWVLRLRLSSLRLADIVNSRRLLGDLFRRV